eukprot:CAMPEP_0178915944 /NCGR_PEP_ID=MMETSP0786-20121207/12334_1 /TAXON_ID=186022 /ORGANISM="Thalassionema frauenfeldii, Strain CCMP 1798" /LENGTH=433 /DNA_ID=CAMNT_0020589163 /DNA_START=33 /DNA_END=1334 /DNA_ORIENTATION=-
MTGGVPSSAAIGTLTVSNSVLENDTVLKLITVVASDKQLKVVRVKKGSDLKLECSENGMVEITQRGAILRSLAGPSLHYVLDDMLLGGHGAASNNAGCLRSCLAMSSIQSWMSVAHNLINGTADLSAVMSQLDSYLETKSFLIPSSRCTLADMEMCVALLKCNKEQNFPGNVARWLKTVHTQMLNLGASNLPSLEIQQAAAPLLLYGTEDFETYSTAAKNSVKAEGKQKDSSGLTAEQKAAAAAKRAKKKADQPGKDKKKANTPAADFDITALDIRVGKILKAWHHETSDKLFCEEIDLGEGEPRQIGSGLRPYYKTEDLVNRNVLVLCNLKSRKLAGFPSHGMVLCASNSDHTNVEFVVPPSGVPLGERVAFGDLTGDPEPENKIAKKKILEKLLPDLKTTADGTVAWKEHKAKTSKGAAKALNGMANATVG